MDELKAERLQRYSTHLADIAREAHRDFTEAEVRVKPAWEDWTRKQRAQVRIPHPVGAGALAPLLVGLVIAAVATAGVAGILFDYATMDPGWQLTLRLILIGAIAAGLASMIAGVQRAIFREQARRRARLASLGARDVFDLTLRAAVRDLVTEALNSVLAPQGLIPFPEEAPALVELNSSRAAKSQCAAHVERFITQHHSSAIGIAGSRGAGKSTIMSVLRAAESADQLTAYLAVPVAYDRDAFLKQVLFETASAIRDRYSHVARRRGSFGDDVVRAFGVVLGVGGRAIWKVHPGASLGIAVGLVIALVSGAIYFGVTAEDLLTPSTALALATVGVLIAGLFYLVLMSEILRVRRAERWHAYGALPAMADQALEWLQYDIELGRKFSSEFKFGEAASLSGERSRTTRARDLTHDTIARSLKALFRRFAVELESARLVILIDELDKVANADAAVDLINHLKEFFHFEGVHFVVSVSVDALRSFELRGVDVRDAFDSSFDTIIEVAPMTTEESLGVLDARVEGFPRLAGLMCHAWAGGLPRDLLRSARRVIEINQSLDQASLSDLISTFVVEETSLTLRSSMRPGSPSMQPLGDLLEIVESLDHKAAIPVEVVHKLDAVEGAGRLARHTALAVAVMGALHSQRARLADSRYANDPAVLDMFTDVAAGFAATSAPEPIWRKATERALDVCLAMMPSRPEP